ncbi:hypothetical protein B296_00046499 [Ensete ventricosum]|uniref:Uncharacterized protein n=1 Tax=Ensete ventricosum TaxID=4639 RepID=A0A426XFV6_ENSVE|nr:hypothetical protein B296_00046499 [Ensete ventricosum]
MLSGGARHPADCIMEGAVVAVQLDQMSGDSELGSRSRLLEWWSSGREEVLQLGSAADSCKMVGSGAYIVGVVDHPYLATRLPLWLTLSSYASTTPVVFTVRDASTGRPYDRWGFGLTCARSAARLLTPPYLRLTSSPCWVVHVGGPVVRRSDDVAARSLCVISFSPPGEDLLEVPNEGAEDEVLCLAVGAREFDVARSDLTEQELENCDVIRADPTEQELGNGDVARADPTEQELGNCDVARVDPTEQELENCDGARSDPTEQELENWNDFCRG